MTEHNFGGRQNQNAQLNFLSINKLNGLKKQTQFDVKSERVVSFSDLDQEGGSLDKSSSMSFDGDSDKGKPISSPRSDGGETPEKDSKFITCFTKKTKSSDRDHKRNRLRIAINNRKTPFDCNETPISEIEPNQNKMNRNKMDQLSFKSSNKTAKKDCLSPI